MRKHIDEMISSRVDSNVAKTLEELSSQKSSWIPDEEVSALLRKRVANDYTEGLKLFERSADIMADTLTRHDMVFAAKGAFDASKEIDADPIKIGDEEYVAVELSEVANKALDVATKGKLNSIVNSLSDRQPCYDLTERKEALKCLAHIKEKLLKTYANLTYLIYDLHDIRFLLQEKGWEFYDDDELEEILNSDD